MLGTYDRFTAEQARKSKQNTTDNLSRDVVLAELLTYIDESKMDEDLAPVVKLADLVKLYPARLQQFGIEQDTRPQSIDLKAYKKGRGVLLAFDRGMGAALRKFYKEDCDDEAICLA